MARYRVDNAYLSEEEYSDFLSRRRSKFIIVMGTLFCARHTLRASALSMMFWMFCARHTLRASALSIRQ